MRMPVTSVGLLTKIGAVPADSAAWGQFVVVYGPHIVRWCRRYGLQDSDAHDVAQEVLLLLSKQMGRFRYDPSKRFRCWLRAVVHSTWCEWSSRRRAWHLGSADPSALEQFEDVAAGEDLLERIVAQYDRELLETASRNVQKRVEPHTWEAYRLLAHDGLSGQEVANRLGVRPNRAYAARHKVQLMIREEFERLDPPQ